MTPEQKTLKQRQNCLVKAGEFLDAKNEIKATRYLQKTMNDKFDPEKSLGHNLAIAAVNFSRDVDSHNLHHVMGQPA